MAESQVTIRGVFRFGLLGLCRWPWMSQESRYGLDTARGFLERIQLSLFP